MTPSSLINQNFATELGNSLRIAAKGWKQWTGHKGTTMSDVEVVFSGDMSWDIR